MKCMKRKLNSLQFVYKSLTPEGIDAELDGWLWNSTHSAPETAVTVTHRGAVELTLLDHVCADPRFL